MDVFCIVFSQPFPRLMEWITALGEALLTSVQSTASRQLRNSSQLIAELLFLAVLSSPPGQKGGTSSAAGPRLTELTWLFLELTEVILITIHTLLCLICCQFTHSKSISSTIPI